jgi:hypothetical protein
VGIRCADHATPLYPQKLALTSPTSGDRSVGIVRLRTKATLFSSIRYQKGFPFEKADSHTTRGSSDIVCGLDQWPVIAICPQYIQRLDLETTSNNYTL